MTRTVEERADRLLGREWIDVGRGTYRWSMLRMGVALADLDRATFRFRRRRQRWKPYLYLAMTVLAFDVLVEVTAMVLDRL